MSSSRDHEPEITGGDGPHPVPSHTPGPWRLGRTGHVIGARVSPVAFTCRGGEFLNYPLEAEANGQLISVAPDLLAALRNIRDGMVASRNEISVDDWIEEAEAAIAKALGDGLGRPQVHQ